MTKKILEQDVVHSFLEEKPDAPIGVRFRQHAAIYFLPRDVPEFSEWLALLQESHRTQAMVRFSYADKGQQLTSVDLVK